MQHGEHVAQRSRVQVVSMKKLGASERRSDLEIREVAYRGAHC